MLELYEQNRVPPSSDVEGSVVSGATHRAPAKAATSNEEHLTGGMRPGTSKPAISRPASELSFAENHDGPARATESRSNNYASTEMKISDQKVDDEFNHDQHFEPEQLPYQEVGEAHNTSRLDSEGTGEDHVSNAGRNDTREVGDKYLGRIENRQVTLGRSPEEVIKNKVKAARERRKNSISDVTRRTDSMDENDLIEREIEDGIELAPASEKTKRERRQNWLKSSNRPENEDLHLVKDQDGVNDEYYQGLKQQSGPDLNNVEEGEVSVFEDSGFCSPKSNNRKRKAGSPLTNEGQPQEKGRKPTG